MYMFRKHVCENWMHQELLNIRWLIVTECELEAAMLNMWVTEYDRTQWLSLRVHESQVFEALIWVASKAPQWRWTRWGSQCRIALSESQQEYQQWMDLRSLGALGRWPLLAMTILSWKCCKLTSGAHRQLQPWKLKVFRRIILVILSSYNASCFVVIGRCEWAPEVAVCYSMKPQWG